MTDNFDRLLLNYSNARKSWEAWCFLNNMHLKTPNPKVRTYVDQNDLMFHLRYLSLKDFHIEMYKILKDSPNNKDNIFGLLREIPSNNPKYQDAMKNIEDLEFHKAAIKDVINIRDKFYAHLDVNYDQYLKNRNLVKDWYKCFELVEQSIITLKSPEYLMNYLDKIPSRDEFELVVPENKGK